MSAAAHQATCVAVDGRAILIEGEPGSGKSSLALALIDRGATLIGDDGVMLEKRDGRLWVMPHPATRGLIELRNVGIATMPSTEAPAALVLMLDRAAPRHVEAADSVVRHGVRLPCLAFWPDSPVAAIRAEMALSIHGLTP